MPRTDAEIAADLKFTADYHIAADNADLRKLLREAQAALERRAPAQLPALSEITTSADSRLAAALHDAQAKYDGGWVGFPVETWQMFIIGWRAAAEAQALECRAPAVTLTDGELQALRIVADHCAGYLNARNIVYAMLDRMAQAAVTYTKCTCADPACNWYLRAPSEAKP